MRADSITQARNHLSFPFFASPKARTVSFTENLAMGLRGDFGCDLCVEAFKRFTSKGDLSAVPKRIHNIRKVTSSCYDQ